PTWTTPPRILLVDDCILNRTITERRLTLLGCIVDAVKDGVGAISRIDKNDYDLIFMDIVMHRGDGISVTSLIRQFNHRIPIIAMTSASEPSDREIYLSS
ncbi:hypothetical protein PUNSTDRAFT_26182, partial [Punctularia strigosozonata HHB-11173 SS5]|uniref:uncharacterized protein n=1 Tax=Punctularia strigosozonata (strain HHB-11173) TaxID=741275 RepID=UPI0004418680